MIRLQFTHIQETDGKITKVRWYNHSTGEVQTHSTGALITWLQKDKAKHAAYVCDGRNIVQVEVVEAKPPYLRTVKDGKATDNLATLPKIAA